jgi:hypothetical protein
LDYAIVSNDSILNDLWRDEEECMSCADDVTDDGLVVRDVRVGDVVLVDDVVDLSTDHSEYRYCCADSTQLAIALAMVSAEQMTELFGKIARNDETDNYQQLCLCRESDISLF